MMPDYTIDDVYKDGFEWGVLYVLRYCDPMQRLSDRDISNLADHLESKKPWRTYEGWETLIHKNIQRWRRMEDTDECG